MGRICLTSEEVAIIRRELLDCDPKEEDKLTVVKGIIHKLDKISHDLNDKEIERLVEECNYLREMWIMTINWETEE